MNNINDIVFKKLVDADKTIVEQLMDIQKDNTILTHTPFQDGLLISYANLTQLGKSMQKQASKEVSHETTDKEKNGVENFDNNER